MISTTSSLLKMSVWNLFPCSEQNTTSRLEAETSLRESIAQNTWSILQTSRERADINYFKRCVLTSLIATKRTYGKPEN